MSTYCITIILEYYMFFLILDTNKHLFYSNNMKILPVNRQVVYNIVLQFIQLKGTFGMNINYVI